MGQSEAPRRVILDVDREHFWRHIKAIRAELDALDNLYLSPRIKGALEDLRLDLETVAAERDEGR